MAMLSNGARFVGIILKYNTARCICIVRYMLWCGVCLSVHLSVTLVHCVKITQLIIKQLALDCSLETLVY